ALGHHYALSNGDAFTSDDGVRNPVFAFFVFYPLNVFFGILFPMLPWIRVVLELQLIHHHDALFHWTYLGAFPAADAVLVVDIIVAVAGRIEAFIRTLNPAKRALGAEIEPDRRPLGFGGATLEHGVSRLSPRTDFESALDCWNRGALLHLEPLGQHGYLMRPHDSVVGLDCLHRWRFGLLSQRFVGCPRRIRPALVFGLFQQISFHRLDPDHCRIDGGNSAQDPLVGQVILVDPKTRKTGVP